jgi:hypothetical protein
LSLPPIGPDFMSRVSCHVALRIVDGRQRPADFLQAAAMSGSSSQTTTSRTAQVADAS